MAPVIICRDFGVPKIKSVTVSIVCPFIFLGSEIIADGGCSHEVKRGLLLGRKAMTVLDSILKSRDITLLTKVCIKPLTNVKVMVFSINHVWMWELDQKNG